MRKILLISIIAWSACADNESSILTEDIHVIGVSKGELCADQVHCEGTRMQVSQFVRTIAPVENDFEITNVSAGDVIDADHDGAPRGKDCDDGDPSRHPSALDRNCDGVDQNCDGEDYCDRDLDGFKDQIDCDAINPDIRDQCHARTPLPASL